MSNIYSKKNIEEKEKEEINPPEKEELGRVEEDSTPEISNKPIIEGLSGKNSDLGKRVEEQVARLRLLLGGELTIRMVNKFMKKESKSPMKTPSKSCRKPAREEKGIQRMGTYHLKSSSGEFTTNPTSTVNITPATTTVLKRGETLSLSNPKPFAYTHRQRAPSRFLPATQTHDDSQKDALCPTSTLEVPAMDNTTSNIHKPNKLTYKKLSFNNLNYDKIGAHGRAQVHFNYLRPVALKGNRTERACSATPNQQFRLSGREYKHKNNGEMEGCRQKHISNIQQERTISTPNILTNYKLNGGIVKGKGRQIITLINNRDEPKVPYNNWVFEETVFGNSVREKVKNNIYNEQNIVLQEEKRKNIIRNYAPQGNQGIISINHKIYKKVSPFLLPQRLVTASKCRPRSSTSKNINIRNLKTAFHTARGSAPGDEMNSRYYKTTDQLTNIDIDK